MYQKGQQRNAVSPGGSDMVEAPRIGKLCLLYFFFTLILGYNSLFGIHEWKELAGVCYNEEEETRVFDHQKCGLRGWTMVPPSL